MLLYLSSNENIGIFDFLAEEKGMLIKKLAGSFHLKQFVIYDMRSLNHFKYFAVELKALKDSEEEIIDAVVALKKMHDSRVIFYIDDLKNNENLVRKLISQGIYNIVSSDEPLELRKEIMEAISGLGMSKRKIQAKLDGSNLNYDDKKCEHQNIKIAFSGTAHKTGTTTLALNLCQYLAEEGAIVCYIEANHSGHLAMLPQRYQQMTVSNNTIIYQGVKHIQLNSDLEEEFDFIIYDMGVLDMKIVHAMTNKCDVRILCATTQPYEIEAYDESILAFEPNRICTIFSFVAEKFRREVQAKAETAYFSDYTPDFFESGNNAGMWEAIMNQYINKTKQEESI